MHIAPMPDQRQHRGPHPEDAGLFHKRHWSALQHATADLSWLLTRNYSPSAALKLTGDRYSLRQRQRLAVLRSACSDQSLADRREREVMADTMSGAVAEIDGLNLLMTVEAALCGGIIIVGRDGCYRDMASVHGTFRLVQETLPALDLIGQFLETIRPGRVRWLLDAPVSNSGRLATRIRRSAEQRGWNWEVDLVADPDCVLQRGRSIVVSADSVVIDRCGPWCNLGRAIISRDVPGAKRVPMAAPAGCGGTGVPEP